MRRALGGYVRKGYGGSRNAARRMGGSAAVGGRLFGAISTLSGGPSGEFTGNLDRQLMQGRSFDEISDALVNSVATSSGSLDAESSRDSMQRALSDLYESDPSADLLNLSEDQRFGVIESFMTREIVNHLLLDCEKQIKEKAPSLAEALDRIRQVKEYVQSEVHASIEQIRATRAIDSRTMSRTLSDLYQITFAVFEDYL